MEAEMGQTMENLLSLQLDFNKTYRYSSI